jgi:DNA modification methylase
VFEITLDNGFLRLDIDLVHPHPKNRKLWRILIESLKPCRIIDPFAGSGTTFEIAEELGISYLGYEKNLSYVTDIEKRIAYGISQRKKIHKPKRLLQI